MITSNDRLYQDDSSILQIFHKSRDNPIKVKCIKDNPPMYGFGRNLKTGDIVEIDGTIHNYLGFCVAVPKECAFYDYSYFTLIDE